MIENMNTGNNFYYSNAGTASNNNMNVNGKGQVYEMSNAVNENRHNKEDYIVENIIDSN